MRRAIVALALLSVAAGQVERGIPQPLTEGLPAPLTEEQWRRYLDITPYEQPKWPRNDPTLSTPHLLLQRAAEAHQEGELDKSVQILKSLLKNDAKHGEAYAALAKVLDDQGKHDLADRAMAKATRIYNDGLAQWSLF